MTTSSVPSEQTSVYTVSQLTLQIKKLLEGHYRFIWVIGEISNLRTPASGHCYFTLKDEQSQIRAVLFRAQQRYLRFVPEDGLQVLCQGRISVFEARGEYQLIVDVMEPRGIGALQLAFEQLKKKLQAEGLFDASRKRPLPLCPQRVGIVTSATGAAIRDILKVLQRSPYSLTVTLLPVLVQGQGAAAEIAGALTAVPELAGKFAWDVMIVGRGGGSLEDLWPFNEEVVARAVAQCPVPVISAVGHEIDLTICDLVSDLRTATPTSAAEWIVAQLEQLHVQLAEQEQRSTALLQRTIDSKRQMVQFLGKRLVDPRRRLADVRLLLDHRLARLNLALRRRLEQLQTAAVQLKQNLTFYNPRARILENRSAIEQRFKEMSFHLRSILETDQHRLQSHRLRLESLSPLAVLARGYSITYRLPEGVIVRKAAEVETGNRVHVQLGEGALECLIENKRPEGLTSRKEFNRGDQEKA